MRESTILFLRSLAIRLGVPPAVRRKALSFLRWLGVMMPARQAGDGRLPNERGMSLDETPAPEVVRLAKEQASRGFDLFFLDQGMIRRQDVLIAKAVSAFFRSTRTYRDSEVDTIARYVGEFREVFFRSPIKTNPYGANFPAGVNLFLMARCLNPELIVESGVYKGQSSYFLAAACPRATIHAFDPDPRQIQYRTPGVAYHANDWRDSEVSCSPPGTGLCYFDDHQNQALRVIQAHERGFRHIIVDDSWPIESVIGGGSPPLPSIDMIMDNPLTPGEEVRWVEWGKIWTYTHTEELLRLCARARGLISAAYEVPSLYRECGLAPTSALKFVELV